MNYLLLRNFPPGHGPGRALLISMPRCSGGASSNEELKQAGVRVTAGGLDIDATTTVRGPAPPRPRRRRPRPRP